MGESPASFAFADLVGFTALTESHGDAEAVVAVDRFYALAHRLVALHGGEEVKRLGDGLMLRFSDPAAAVRCSLEVVVATRGHERLGVRVGVDFGTAVAHEGDWLGATVNLAARVAAQASARGSSPPQRSG